MLNEFFRLCFVLLSVLYHKLYNFEEKKMEKADLNRMIMAMVWVIFVGCASCLNWWNGMGQSERDIEAIFEVRVVKMKWIEAHCHSTKYSKSDIIEIYAII